MAAFSPCASGADNVDDHSETRLNVEQSEREKRFPSFFSLATGNIFLFLKRSKSARESSKRSVKETSKICRALILRTRRYSRLRGSTPHSFSRSEYTEKGKKGVKMQYLLPRKIAQERIYFLDTCAHLAMYVRTVYVGEGEKESISVVLLLLLYFFPVWDREGRRAISAQ